MNKNKIIGILLTTLLFTHSAFAISVNLGVQKGQEKNKPEKVKVNKKNTNWTKLRITNKYDYINMDWWEALGDEQLNTYIQQAIDHNYSAKVASLVVDEYYQNVKLQRAKELPTVAGGILPNYGGTNHESDFGMPIPLVVNYEADIFLKNHDKTKSVKKVFEATIQDERAAYISIASAVGTTYFNIIQLDKLIENQTQMVRLRQEIYDATLLSNKEGLMSTLEVVRANKALITNQMYLIEMKKARVNALNQLAVLIGESPENIDSFKRSRYEEIQYKYNIPKNISSEIITQRPDYIKAEIMLQKAGIDVRVAKKEFLPTINIGGMALFNSINVAQGFPHFLWGVGGNVLESISLGGMKIANLKRNKILYEKMLQIYQNTNLTSIQEVNDAMYNYRFNNEKYDQNVENLRLEIKNYDLAEKEYNEGVISKLELNEKQENLLSIQNIVVKNKIACIVDSIGLYKAVGAGVNKTSRLPF